MINVSDSFKSAVIGQNRQTQALIEFEILDVDANTDATATVTSESILSQKTQLFNQVRLMSGKYATFENDYWSLDGSFVLPPKSTESGFEVGWWSNALSGLSGIYSVNQEVICDFTQDQSSIGLTITFDVLTNEYAKDFVITAYDSSNNIIHTETVTNNTLSTYVLQQNLLNFRKIIITISKWCKENRRARITEIDFGIIKRYTDVEIIKMNILEEVDTTGNEVTANEIKFTLENKDKSFNILNPTGIYPFLQRKQKIKPYFGTVITDTLTEYIPMGVFYLVEWKSDEGTLTATFTARDILDIISDDKIPETTYTNKSIKYILNDILTQSGITSFNIDSNLDSITVSGTIKESTYREAVQIVAMAGMSIVYTDRYGILNIKQFEAGTTVSTLDYNNVYSAPQIKLDKLINTVDVKYSGSTYTYVDPLKPTNEATLSVKIDNPLIGTLSHATDVAIWILNQLKKRFIYEVNWRGNQSLEILDNVVVEDDFSEDKAMVITKNEFDYEGALSCKTNGRGWN